MTALTVPNQATRLDRKSEEDVTRLARINKAFEALAKASAKMHDMIQFTACDIVFHAVEHGDVTPADRMVALLGNGVRRDSLVAWFCTVGCMKVEITEDTKGKKQSKFTLDKSRREKLAKWIDAEGETKVFSSIRAQSWAEAKKESNPMLPLDLTKALRALINRANKAKENPEIAAKSDLALLDKLVALVPVAAKQTA